MAKKSYNNYDDALFGQYIRQIENADSAGWNASDRIWRAPQRKGLDKRNRGMGVDVLNNLDTKALTKNRPGQYLTEKEEHQLRNEHIQYLLDVINKRKEEDNPALKSMSPKKQAQVLGIMYRGDAPELWKENTILGKALISNKDEDMDKAIKDFYESKGLGERAKNDSIFWNNQKIQNKSKAVAVPQPHINNTVEYQDAIKTYRPAVMPSQIKRDTKKAMQDKVDFHNFMDSISIQNNLPPAYTPKSNIHSEGGFMYEPRDAWKALPLSEKAEMMKVAVRNGITNLQDIRQKYNEFAEGGNIYKEGGKKKSSSANPSAQRAMRYFMDKGLTDYQAAGLVGNLMRESGMNPQALNKGSKAYGLAQWLGPRKKALFARYGNNPSLENQLDFIWSELNSTHKNGLRHLRSSKSAEEAARNAMGYYEFSAGPEAAIANMRKYGQDGEGSMRKGISFASSLMGQPISAYNPRQNEATQLSLQESTIPSEGFIYTPLNPQVFGIADTPSYTINVPDQTLTSEPQIEESSVSLYSPEELDRQERMDRLSAFNNMLRMTSPQGGGNVFLDAIGMLTGNAFADGGGIHIKPENRGKFTALKERTGHSATWFKEHGTPAQKKMATFALNARHWKHGLGGNLYDDDGSYSYTKPLDNVFVDSEGNLLDPSVPSARGTVQLPEIIVTTRDPRKPVPTAFDGSIAPWLEVGEMLAKPLNVFSPSQQFGAVADAVQGKRNYFESVFNGNSGFFTDQYAQEHPYLTMTGNLGGDILSGTALSKVPELAASAYKGIVQPGMRLFNSPLTGNWTKISNREYRLNPNSLGTNGSPLEARSITPQITAENAVRMTPEQWNVAYRAAYERGDKAEGQRLWDLWFRQQAKNNKLVSENNFPVKLRHNTNSEPWNIYDESYFNSATGDGGWYGKGLYTSGNSWGEEAYGKNTMNLYGYMEEPAVVPPSNIGLDEIPENFTTGYIARDFFNQGISKEDYIKNLSGDALEWNKEYPELISKAINNTEKADGIIVQREASKLHPFTPFDEVVLPKGTHIKSAEPFTLDDNGRLIDLTNRANFNINDLRYGLIPFGIGLTGYGIFGRDR